MKKHTVSQLVTFKDFIAYSKNLFIDTFEIDFFKSEVIFKIWDKFHLKDMENLSVIAKKRINILFDKIEQYNNKFDIDSTMQILASEIMED